MSLLRHGWRYVRRHGVMAAVRATCQRYIYRSSQWIVFRADLAGPPASDHVGDVVFRRATVADFDSLLQLEPYGHGSSEVAGVLDDNDWLFIAVHGDRVVATRRYTRALPAYGVMARVVTLEPGQLWMDDTFCLPEYRNRGIARLLGLFADRYLAARGYTGHFTSVALSNTASLRMSLHKGSQPVYHVSCHRVLLHERLLVSPSLPAEVEWLREPVTPRSRDAR